MCRVLSLPETSGAKLYPHVRLLLTRRCRVRLSPRERIEVRAAGAKRTRILRGATRRFEVKDFAKQMAAMPRHVSIASRPSDSMFLTHLSCTSCGLHHDWTKLQNLCTACRKPLLAVYDLERAGRALRHEELSTRAEKSLWRYRELLPVPIETAPVSLGEGRNSFASRRNVRRLFANAGSPGQRRIAESDSKFQGARDVRRRFDGETSRRFQTRRSQRRQRRQRPRRLRCTRRTRSPRLHATRYATGQYHRMPRARCPRNLDRRPDYRLRC